MLATRLFPGRALISLLLLTAVGMVTPSNAATLVTNFFSVATDDFANPERGFYLHTETRASAPSPVPNNLALLRLNGSRDPNGAYVAHVSLVLRVIYLDTFAQAPISSNFLATIESDLTSIRNQGDKAILRFAYFDRPDRPFPEPSKAQILQHIAQLTPLLRRNADVVAVLQHGFIGAWGEGYYTDVFSTAGQLFTAENWRDRAEVIQALLDALPSTRMIQVRVPQQRQKFLAGVAAPLSTPPSAEPAGFDGSAASRIGFHNDCFLADATDAGTFSDYEQSTEPADTALLRAYQAAETRVTPMGGETCLENAPADDCAGSGGRADSDLALFHYSFLNQSYNANVNDDWAVQGCAEGIKQKLGYRLELISGVFPSEAAAGRVMPLRLELRNSGYTAPFNPRGIELILRQRLTGRWWFGELSRDVDARRWGPGPNRVIDTRLVLPADLPAGSYELLLSLPDPAPALYAQPAFSIRMANDQVLDAAGQPLIGVWESATGFNRLGHFLLVTASPTGDEPSGDEIPILPYSAIRENYQVWRVRNFGSGAEGDPQGDDDQDGWSNLAEYALGTSPKVASSRPVLGKVEDGGLTLSIPKAPGTKDVAYEVETSPTLSPANWSTNGISVLADNPMVLRVRRDAAGISGFLRLRVRLK